MTKTLHGGPLSGQVVTISPTVGGGMPKDIYPHAPLPPDHGDEPAPRHAYRYCADGEYHHGYFCRCRRPVDTPAQ